MENKQNVAEHKRRNRDMFNAIARRYDLLNHLLSGGVDVYWRRRALDCALEASPQRVLDLGYRHRRFCPRGGAVEAAAGRRY